MQCANEHNITFVITRLCRHENKKLCLHLIFPLPFLPSISPPSPVSIIWFRFLYCPSRESAGSGRRRAERSAPVCGPERSAPRGAGGGDRLAKRDLCIAGRCWRRAERGRRLAKRDRRRTRTGLRRANKARGRIKRVRRAHGRRRAEKVRNRAKRGPRTIPASK